jgi:ceramide glucosyltransferase
LTLLKPLKGCDPSTRECLRSWFGQKYPGPVQILFGAASAEDPVRAVVAELLAEFPEADAQWVLCGETLGANAKVSTLRQLEPRVRHQVVMISDADVKVTPDFAAQVVARLEETKAGLVNCFYRLANGGTPAMEWEAVAVNADFWTQVLQARSLKPVDFALGAVMALPLADLQAAGGFAALADYLADDYQLGQRVSNTGKTIEFATVVAECQDAPMNWRQVWAHQARWARTIRACQPGPFFASVLNNATVWPLLWWAAGGGRAGWAFLGCACFRIGTALHQQSRLTQARPKWAWWWMAPVKDLLDAAVWAGAFLGNTVVWRGEKYRVLAGGKLQRTAGAPSQL